MFVWESIFEQYPKIIKADGPLIHFMFTEMKNLLTMLMRQFLESTVVNGKVVKDLMDADVRDPSNQLQLFKMCFGLEVQIQIID